MCSHLILVTQATKLITLNPRINLSLNETNDTNMYQPD